MSILFKSIRKFSLNNPSNPPKWYAMAVSSGETCLDDLAVYATETSTVSKADILAVFEATFSKVSQDLSEGKIVRVGEYFTLQMSVSSEGVDFEQDLNSSKIKSCRMLFRPGKMFRRMMKLSSFEKI